MTMFNNRMGRLIVLLALLALAIVLTGTLLMARGQQVTLPFPGLQSHQQVMPPDPDAWCRQVKLTKLDNEIEKAEFFFSEGIGESQIDWRYLRQALKYTGVQVNGPEDDYWLQTIKGLYSGCTR